MTNSTRRDALGVLALQGDYVEHQRMLERLGCPSRSVRKASELDEIDALILPGGESTTMIKFIPGGGPLGAAQTTSSIAAQPSTEPVRARSSSPRRSHHHHSRR